jgi:hypothetical protein
MSSSASFSTPVALENRIAIAKRSISSTLLTSLVYAKSATRSFQKRTEFFDLDPNKTGGDAKKRHPSCCSVLADAEADVADGFAPEALF